MKRLPIIFALGFALSLGTACSDDGNGNGDADANEDLTPPVPTLGNQIDRAGRPAISSALVGVFDFLGDNVGDKTAYNTADDPAEWNAAFFDVIKAHVAIYDSLDTITDGGGGCDATDNMNSALRGLTLNGDEPPYAVLATVLADDRLYIDSTSGVCTDTDCYLAVELNFISGGGAVPDGGGRSPTIDAVAESYTALAAGVLDGSIDDGPAVDPDGAPNNNAFPFLNAPQ